MHWIQGTISQSSSPLYDGAVLDDDLREFYHLHADEFFSCGSIIESIVQQVNLYTPGSYDFRFMTGETGPRDDCLLSFSPYYYYESGDDVLLYYWSAARARGVHVGSGGGYKNASYFASDGTTPLTRIYSRDTVDGRQWVLQIYNEEIEGEEQYLDLFFCEPGKTMPCGYWHLDATVLQSQIDDGYWPGIPDIMAEAAAGRSSDYLFMLDGMSHSRRMRWIPRDPNGLCVVHVRNSGYVPIPGGAGHFRLQNPGSTGTDRVFVYHSAYPTRSPFARYYENEAAKQIWTDAGDIGDQDSWSDWVNSTDHCVIKYDSGWKMYKGGVNYWAYLDGSDPTATDAEWKQDNLGTISTIGKSKPWDYCYSIESNTSVSTLRTNYISDDSTTAYAELCSLPHLLLPAQYMSQPTNRFGGNLSVDVVPLPNRLGLGAVLTRTRLNQDLDTYSSVVEIGQDIYVDDDMAPSFSRYDQHDYAGRPRTRYATPMMESIEPYIAVVPETVKNRGYYCLACIIQKSHFDGSDWVVSYEDPTSVTRDIGDYENGAKASVTFVKTGTYYDTYDDLTYSIYLGQWDEEFTVSNRVYAVPVAGYIDVAYPENTEVDSYLYLDYEFTSSGLSSQRSCVTRAAPIHRISGCTSDIGLGYYDSTKVDGSYSPPTMPPTDDWINSGGRQGA